MESVTVKNFVCILSANSIQKQLKIESFREKTKKVDKVKNLINLEFAGADERSRTAGLLITKNLLFT